MESLWKESTARLLDPKETPVGSMTSLQWHLAETLALYWSSSNGPPPKQASQNQRRTRGSTETADTAVQEKWLDVTKQANTLALQMVDRLAQEKNAATSTDDDDFRTIGVSLVHAILKQWKDGLHWANNNNNNQVRQNKDDESMELTLPSTLLQKLDSWTSTRLFEPNIATYTILMDGAVSCRNYHERVTFAEDLLDRLLNECALLEDAGEDASRLRPTAVTIGTVIHALANTRTKAAAEQAEDWLRKIPFLYEEEYTIRANTVIYTTVIRAWADVGRADKAEGLLREMCNDYVGSEGIQGNPDAKPSLWTFNTVLAAWSRSKNPSSVIQAEGLIRTMKSLSSHENDEESNSVLKLDVSPTIVSYNSLMSTIASKSKHPDSLTRAELWMEEILANAAAAAAKQNESSSRRKSQQRGPRMGRKNDDSMTPNFITYRALFNIIAGASDLTNAEKADRMRYWLARVDSPTLSQTNSSRETSNLTENPKLLAQIHAMEQRGNN